MKKPVVGGRVFAVLSTSDTEVRLFGYGTYVADEVPDEQAGGFAALSRAMNRPNPKILLDSGKVVWGGECWWGPEEAFKAMVVGRKVTEVDIDVARAMERAP